jgi:radical SAM protein with 4Fe4S-binding SPASM domain
MANHPVFDMPNPRSLILRMDITNICNLDCVGCALIDNRKALGEPAASMKVDTFEKIANEVFPYLFELALSCEAEPILHPQFGRIMGIISEKTEKNSRLPVRMTTNATLLTPAKLDAIFDSGMFALNISIDGFEPQTFSRLRKNGEISTVFEAMDEIVRRKTALGRQSLDTPRLSINYTVMKSNLHELIPLIEHSRRWGIEDFTVTHVYSAYPKDMSHEFLSDCPEESDRVLTEARMKCEEYGINPRFPALFRPSVQHVDTPRVDIPKTGLWERLTSRLRPTPALRQVPSSAEPDLACSAPWRMLKIRWDGSVHPCDLWNAHHPLGNLQTQSFQEIWKSEKYTELRSGLFNGMPTFEHCINCDRISQDNLERRKLQSPLAHTSVGKAGVGRK